MARGSTTTGEQCVCVCGGGCGVGVGGVWGGRAMGVPQGTLLGAGGRGGGDACRGESTANRVPGASARAHVRCALFSGMPSSSSRRPTDRPSGHRTATGRAPRPLAPCPTCRLIQPTVAFTWRSAELGGADVLLTGSFNSWAELLPLAYDARAGQHSLRCCLPQGHYEFQVGPRPPPQAPPTGVAGAGRCCREVVAM